MASNQMVCTMCGYVGNAKKHTRGSIFLEIVLWLLFLVPGLIYSVWRLTTRQMVCPKCKNPTMIPVDSPNGQKFVQAVDKKAS